MICLPPLLYDAAFTISFNYFRTNSNTIGTLAVGLVFLTASGIAIFAHYFIPGMTLSLSFVLGAILSVTDAVAAISITKGCFVFWQASPEFVKLISGGVLVGMILAKILGYVLIKVKDNMLVTNSFMLLMFFVTYLVAEQMNVYGVISIIILGLGISRFG